MRRLLAVPFVVVLALGIAACSDDDEPDAGTTTTTDNDATTQPNGDGTDSEDGSGTSEDPTGSSTSDSAPVEEGDLPGEQIDTFPYDGAELGVIGVAADDTLNLRSGPGTRYDVVTELAPLAQDFTATGHNRSIDNESIWVQVEVDGKTGWVNGSFVAQPGGTNDVTSQLEGEIVGDTMLELAEEVSDRYVGPAEAEGPRRRFVTVDGPTSGDLGEITVDVIGLGDDALTGYRLHVFGTPGEGGGDAFFLKSVESTPLCTRGVSDEGLCL